jgi:dihydrofolate reductase
MSNVVVHRSASLDGFIAGPGHEMDWIFEHPHPDLATGVMGRTGAIVAGRGSHRVGERSERAETSAAYGGAWSGAEFVLTHDDLDLPDGVTRLDGDIRDVVATAREAARGRDVELFGADVARQAFAAGLVDEVVVHVLPVVLGEGVAFSPGSGRVDLELVEHEVTGSVVSLRYRVSARR